MMEENRSSVQVLQKNILLKAHEFLGYYQRRFVSHVVEHMICHVGERMVCHMDCHEGEHMEYHMVLQVDQHMDSCHLHHATQTLSMPHASMGLGTIRSYPNDSLPNSIVLGTLAPEPQRSLDLCEGTWHCDVSNVFGEIFQTAGFQSIPAPLERRGLYNDLHSHVPS